METEFEIDSIGFEDEDQPLTFKYSYYLSLQDYENEKLLGSYNLKS